MNIRTYQDSDFEPVCAVFLRSVKEIASRDYSPAQIAAWAQVDEARWQQKLADSRVLIADQEGKVAGFITAAGSYIDLLFVSPDFQRQGVARELLHALLKESAEMTMTVEASITAKPFFARYGFDVQAEQRVLTRGETFTNYRMILRREGNTG